MDPSVKHKVRLAFSLLSLLVFSAALLLPNLGKATSTVGSYEIAAANIAFAWHSYPGDEGGNRPKLLNDLEKTGLNLLTIEKHLGMPVDSAFTILSDKRVVKPKQRFDPQGEVLIVGTLLTADSRYPGRVFRPLIWQTEGGEIHYKMYDNGLVEDWFAASGVALPTAGNFHQEFPSKVLQRLGIADAGTKTNAGIRQGLEASRIAARVGELGRAATNDAGVADASVQGAATPEAQVAGASRGRTWLAVAILAAVLGSLGGWMFLSRRRP
jgi:hypothetical protein